MSTATLAKARAKGVILNDDAHVATDDTVAIEGGTTGRFIDQFAGSSVDCGSTSELMFGSDVTGKQDSRAVSHVEQCWRVQGSLNSGTGGWEA